MMTDWQPIETAPKETRVLVWRPRETDENDAHAGVDIFLGKYWWHSRFHQQPTHWMPLPGPPST